MFLFPYLNYINLYNNLKVISYCLEVIAPCFSIFHNPALLKFHWCQIRESLLAIRKTAKYKKVTNLPIITIVLGTVFKSLTERVK